MIATSTSSVEARVRDHGQRVDALLAHESSGCGDRGVRIDGDQHDAHQLTRRPRAGPGRATSTPRCTCRGRHHRRSTGSDSAMAAMRSASEITPSRAPSSPTTLTARTAATKRRGGDLRHRCAGRHGHHSGGHHVGHGGPPSGAHLTPPEWRRPPPVRWRRRLPRWGGRS